MRINGIQLSSMFQSGATLDGAMVSECNTYGEHYADGSAEGCEVILRRTDGSTVRILFDTVTAEGLTVEVFS